MADHEPFHWINTQTVVNQSMASSFVSTTLDIDEVTSYSIQATWTGTPVGTVKAQGSNNVALLGWTDITDSISAVSGPGTYLLNVERPSYSFVQFVYTFTSGTGTMNAVLNAKRD